MAIGGRILNTLSSHPFSPPLYLMRFRTHLPLLATNAQASAASASASASPSPSSSSSAAAAAAGASPPPSSAAAAAARRQQTVSVFWDLDNKPPIAVPPYSLAQRLKHMASRFGRVIDVVAYANRHAFTYLPGWVQQERLQRKIRDEMEVKGIVKVEEAAYQCGYCGRKCRNNVALQKHFKQLHERERNKRLNRLNSLKGKRRLRYWEGLDEKEKRYKEAARGILIPKKGYGLASELRRAGVVVRTVSDKPQSADVALKNHIVQAIYGGVGCICLISDDSDFADVLDLAREWQLQTVVVGENQKLRKHASMSLSWEYVASGLPLAESSEATEMWCVNEPSRKFSSYEDIVSSQHSEIFVRDNVQSVELNSWRRDEEDDFDATDLSLGDDIDSDCSDTEYPMAHEDEKIASNIWLHDNLSDSDSDEFPL